MIALNGHPFQLAALQQYVDQAMASMPVDSNGVLTAAVDNNGAKVVIVFANEDGHLKFAAALAHDWSGDTQFSATGSVSF